MKRKKIIILSALALIVLAASFAAFRFLGGATAFQQKTRVLYIPTGKNNKAYVMQTLKDSGWLKNPGSFNWLAGKMGCWSRLKPGRYEISRGTSILHLVKKLRNGVQDPVKLVIIKLRTREEVARKIGAQFECGAEPVLNILNNNESLRAMGADTAQYLASIIPNTYSILWNTPADKILSRLFAEAKKFWNEERQQQAKNLGYTPEQIMTIASIVEEETTRPEDKGTIARVYLNRLAKNMKLEADPTLKFALGDFSLTRIKEIHKKITAASPFNTYTHAGLPPGPICTPSVKTIDATLNAPASDYIFFVAQPNFSGLSNFAADYSEHLKYAAIYHRFLDSLETARKLKKEKSE
jgi:UPF0755 protein